MATLILPYNPQQLTQMLMASELQGNFFMEISNVNFFCPSQQVTSLTYPVTPGTTIIYCSPAKFTSTYYSPSIYASMLIDNVPYIGNLFPYALTQSDTYSTFEYTFSKENLVITITNDSPYDCYVSAFGEIVHINSTFFNDFYTTLMNAALSDMESFAGMSTSTPTGGDV